MKAIAIDDEPMALEVVRAHAARVPFLELSAVFTDAFEAMSYLQQHPVDLLFLDIKMPDISGIEFFQSLSRKPLLIFTTAYSEHAVQSFELDAVDYLLKPFSFARFLKGCNKAYELFKIRGTATVSDHLYVKTGYESVKVFYSDIRYLEASGNYVTFVLQGGKNILSRNTFSEAIALLPPDRFARVHRSYVVNLGGIDKVEKHQVTLGSQVIPVSEAYSRSLQEMLGRIR